MRENIPPEIGDLMHDIGGLVTTVNGWAKVALERARSGEIPEDDLSIVEEESAILADIVRETLHVVRFGSPRTSKPIRLADVISSLIRASDRGEQAKIRLRDHTAHGRCRGPGAFVRRAIQNPLYNALRHARRRVEIEIREEDAFALIAISDDGPGMCGDPEELFSRSAGTGRTRMGLASARWCAELLGGSARFAEPSRGAGARIEIRIPLADDIRGGRSSRSSTGASHLAP